MRKIIIPLLAIAVFGLPASAQQAQQPAGLNPANNQLDAVLVGWEKAMSTVEKLEAGCTRTTIDKTLQKQETFKGTAKFLKSANGSLASLELKHESRPEIFEKLVCSRTFVYQFVPQLKVIKVYDLPPKQNNAQNNGQNNQVADDNLLSFLFGMKAAQAKERYHLVLKASDQYYHYVDILPKTQADAVDFKRARLVLIKSNSLPRQLWFEEPNGNEITWDFPTLNTQAQLDTRDFDQPALPQGWQWVRVPNGAQPRLIRNQQ